MKRVYLDYNASTPTDPRVRAHCRALEDAGEPFANPSSVHAEGRRARSLVEEARSQVAAAVGAEPAEVLFTGSATEANHMAILGVARARQQMRRRVVLTGIEHPCVLGACDQLAAAGWDVAVVPSDRSGAVDADRILRAADEHTALAAVMLANNETGVLQPIEEIAAGLHQRGVWLHVDAAQALGRVPLDFATLGAHSITLSGHKIYAGKGAGALVMRRGLQLGPFLSGHQERGRRGGTENTLALAAFGLAAAFAQQDLSSGEVQRQGALRSELWNQLGHLPGLRRIGEDVQTLANTLALLLPSGEAEAMVIALDLEGVCVSSGAACTSGSTEPSRVLQGMGYSEEEARRGLRISVGRFTSPADIGAAAERFRSVYARVMEGETASARDWARWANLEDEWT